MNTFLVNRLVSLVLLFLFDWNFSCELILLNMIFLDTFLSDQTFSARQHTYGSGLRHFVHSKILSTLIATPTGVIERVVQSGRPFRTLLEAYHGAIKPLAEHSSCANLDVLRL